MISVAFINDGYEPLITSDPFLPLNKMMVEMTEEIDMMISSYLKIHDQYTTESEIMGELDEDKSVYLEAEKTNIFDKIGNAVISIAKKIQNIIKKIIDAFKNIGFKNKSNEEKIQALLDKKKKEDPENYKDIKNEVIAKFNSGELNPVDMKTLKEMNDVYDEIVKLSKQKDVKPDSIRAKFDAMKKKFDNIDKPVKTISSIITVAIAMVTFKSKVLDARKNTIEYEKKLSEKNEATIKAIKELQQYENGEYASDSLSKAQILKNANFWINNQYEKLISKEQGTIDKLDKGITAWIAKHEKNKKDKFMDGVERGSTIISNKEKQKRDDERTKNYQDARDKADGQRDSNDDAILGTDSRHRKAIKQETRIKTQSQTRAQRYENDKAINNNLQHQNAIETQAELQARGRGAGTP